MSEEYLLIVPYTNLRYSSQVERIHWDIYASKQEAVKYGMEQKMESGNGASYFELVSMDDLKGWPRIDDFLELGLFGQDIENHYIYSDTPFYIKIRDLFIDIKFLRHNYSRKICMCFLCKKLISHMTNKKMELRDTLCR